MEIQIHDLGKKFRKNWVFRKLNLQIQSGDRMAITGPNGSGKSTLLQIIAGSMPATAGSIKYKNEQNKEIDTDHVHRYLSFSAPYLELIEEMTLVEMINFHFKFKTIEADFTTEKIIREIWLEEAKDKKIKEFSSGMKQRLKLALCFFSQTPLLFLDEPTTNLDEKGINWYQNALNRVGKDKILLVSSNDKREYKVCEKIVYLEDYKTEITS